MSSDKEFFSDIFGDTSYKSMMSGFDYGEYIVEVTELTSLE